MVDGPSPTGSASADVAARHGVPAALVDAIVELSDAVRVGQLDGELPTVEAEVERPEGAFTLQASLYGDGTVLVVLSILPEAVPEDRRAAVAALVAGLNWRLVVGNAEMDPTDGTVRFRTGLLLAGDELTAGQADAVVRANIATSVLLFPAVRAVAAGDEAADAALERLSAHVEAHGIDLGS